jgi:hypothetical protein
LERDQRTAAPAHATGAVEFVALDDVAPDETFRLRPDGDVSLLATSLGRLGQLAPLELRPWPGAGTDGPRWQIVAGFRRLAAVRLLARERVLARLHGTLSDDDAWAVALSDALLREPLSADELAALRARLAASGAAPWADELLDEALVRAPVSAELRERFFEFLKAGTGASETSVAIPIPTSLPPSAESEPPPAGVELVEVTPDELVQDLVARLSQVNQDLAVAFEAWADLPPEGRRAISEQARYIAELMPFMERE